MDGRRGNKWDEVSPPSFRHVSDDVQGVVPITPPRSSVVRNLFESSAGLVDDARGSHAVHMASSTNSERAEQLSKSPDMRSAITLAHNTQPKGASASRRLLQLGRATAAAAAGAIDDVAGGNLDLHAGGRYGAAGQQRAAVDFQQQQPHYQYLSLEEPVGPEVLGPLVQRVSANRLSQRSSAAESAASSSAQPQQQASNQPRDTSGGSASDDSGVANSFVTNIMAAGHDQGVRSESHAAAAAQGQTAHEAEDDVQSLAKAAVMRALTLPPTTTTGATAAATSSANPGPAVLNSHVTDPAPIRPTSALRMLAAISDTAAEEWEEEDDDDDDNGFGQGRGVSQQHSANREIARSYHSKPLTRADAVSSSPGHQLHNDTTTSSASSNSLRFNADGGHQQGQRKQQLKQHQQLYQQLHTQHRGTVDNQDVVHPQAGGYADGSIDAFNDSNVTAGSAIVPAATAAKAPQPAAGAAPQHRKRQSNQQRLRRVEQALSASSKQQRPGNHTDADEDTEAIAAAADWRSAVTPDGRVYFYHRTTRVSVWALPAGVDARYVKHTAAQPVQQQQHGAEANVEQHQALHTVTSAAARAVHGGGDGPLSPSRRCNFCGANGTTDWLAWHVLGCAASNPNAEQVVMSAAASAAVSRAMSPVDRSRQHQPRATGAGAVKSGSSHSGVATVAIAAAPPPGAGTASLANKRALVHSLLEQERANRRAMTGGGGALSATALSATLGITNMTVINATNAAAGILSPSSKLGLSTLLTRSPQVPVIPSAIGATGLRSSTSLLAPASAVTPSLLSSTLHGNAVARAAARTAALDAVRRGPAMLLAAADQTNEVDDSRIQHHQNQHQQREQTDNEQHGYHRVLDQQDDNRDDEDEQRSVDTFAPDNDDNVDAEVEPGRDQHDRRHQRDDGRRPRANASATSAGVMMDYDDDVHDHDNNDSLEAVHGNALPPASKQPEQVPQHGRPEAVSEVDSTLLGANVSAVLPVPATEGDEDDGAGANHSLNDMMVINADGGHGWATMTDGLEMGGSQAAHAQQYHESRSQQQQHNEMSAEGGWVSTVAVDQQQLLHDSTQQHHDVTNVREHAQHHHQLQHDRTQVTSDDAEEAQDDSHRLQQQQMHDDDQAEHQLHQAPQPVVDDQGRIQCGDCGRFFAPDRVSVHARACKSVFGSHRSPFPTKSVRLKDTPASSLTFTSKSIPPCSWCGKRFPVENDAKVHAFACKKRQAAGAPAGSTSINLTTLSGVHNNSRSASAQRQQNRNPSGRAASAGRNGATARAAMLSSVTKAACGIDDGGDEFAYAAQDTTVASAALGRSIANYARTPSTAPAGAARSSGGGRTGVHSGMRGTVRKTIPFASPAATMDAFGDDDDVDNDDAVVMAEAGGEMAEDEPSLVAPTPSTMHPLTASPNKAIASAIARRRAMLVAGGDAATLNTQKPSAAVPVNQQSWPWDEEAPASAGSIPEKQQQQYHPRPASSSVFSSSMRNRAQYHQHGDDHDHDVNGGDKGDEEPVAAADVFSPHRFASASSAGVGQLGDLSVGNTTNNASRIPHSSGATRGRRSSHDDPEVDSHGPLRNANHRAAASASNERVPAAAASTATAAPDPSLLASLKSRGRSRSASARGRRGGRDTQPSTERRLEVEEDRELGRGNLDDHDASSSSSAPVACASCGHVTHGPGALVQHLSVCGAWKAKLRDVGDDHSKQTTTTITTATGSRIPVPSSAAASSAAARSTRHQVSTAPVSLLSPVAPASGANVVVAATVARALFFASPQPQATAATTKSSAPLLLPAVTAPSARPQDRQSQQQQQQSLTPDPAQHPRRQASSTPLNTAAAATATALKTKLYQTATAPSSSAAATSAVASLAASLREATLRAAADADRALLMTSTARAAPAALKAGDGGPDAAASFAPVQSSLSLLKSKTGRGTFSGQVGATAGSSGSGGGGTAMHPVSKLAADTTPSMPSKSSQHRQPAYLSAFESPEDPTSGPARSGGARQQPATRSRHQAHDGTSPEFAERPVSKLKSLSQRHQQGYQVSARVASGIGGRQQ